MTGRAVSDDYCEHGHNVTAAPSETLPEFALLSKSSFYNKQEF